MGALSWDGIERRLDRYGSVTFWDEDSEDRKLDGIPVYHNMDALEELEGTKGSLYALIVDTRKSTHIGDLFRGFKPTTPKIGDKIVLGKGRLFYHDNGNYVSIGLQPLDGREKDWLDPKSLYRCHEQTVNLYFEYMSDAETK